MDNQLAPLLENEYNYGEDLSPTNENDIDEHLSSEVRSQCSNLKLDLSVSATSYIDRFSIVYVDFPQVFYKKQVQVDNQSMQRIVDGNICFLLDFGSPEQKKVVKSIAIKVMRTLNENPDYSNQQLNGVFIKSRFSPVQKSKILVKLNLDSVDELNNYEVCIQRKSLRDDQKKFHLEVHVIFTDNTERKENTHSFILVGRKRPHESKTVKKRSRKSSYDSSLSRTEKVLEERSKVANHVQTKSIQLGQKLLLDQTIQTTNGNIAYHWPLENEDESFEEGEVVGFIADRNGKYHLKKLTLQNCSEALLKGVISRSFYLQAQIPADGRLSETICMMGIVPVQVKGLVCINDALYASPCHPGFAVSSYYLNVSLLQSSALIGYAFSSHNAASKEIEGMVQAGVSVLETASGCLRDERFRALEERMDFKLKNIHMNQKRFKRYHICVALCVILAILTGALISEIFVPGSSLRYFICKRGSLKGSAFFQFVPWKDPTINAPVNGIEFEFSTLMQKTKHTGYKRLNMTGVRYFINIDRCAYGLLREMNNIPLSGHSVYGPEVFAVDRECHHAYYYNEVHESWIRYNSVSWEKKEISCHPP